MTYNKEKLEQLEGWFYKHYAYFNSVMVVALALRNKEKKIPWLQCDQSASSYTDDAIINIGLQTLALFDVETEEEFIFYTTYLMLHEVGHIRRTPAKPWQFGLSSGPKRICQAIAKILGIKKTFNTLTDVDDFLKEIAKDGIHLSYKELQSLCHGIQNSIEDGRMERIEAKQSKTFHEGMIAGRAKFWINQPCRPETVSEIATGNAAAQLQQVLNEILMLATTGMYSKDFVNLLYGTETFDIVDSALDFIDAGVMAPQCRGAMDNSINIEETIAPLILEVAKQAKPTSKDEGEGSSSSSGNEGEGGGKSSSSSASGVAKKGSTVGEICGDVFSDKTQPGNKTEPKGLGSAEAKDEEGEEEGESGHLCSIFNGEMPQRGEAPKGKAGKETPGCTWDHNTQRAGHENIGSTGNEVSEADVEAVKRAVAQAIADAASKINGAIRTANSKKPKPVVNQSQEPVQPDEKVEAQYQERVHFNEVKHDYDKTPLKFSTPTDIVAAANEIYEELKEYLLSENVDEYGLKTGVIDEDALTGLFLGDQELFYREGEPKKFDVATYILMDNSGSMGYGAESKRAYACEAAAVCELSFGQFAATKITAFDAQGSNFVTHECIKEFEEVQENSCAYNFLRSGRGGCGNKDGYSIRVATQELRDRSEKTKILLVLSDGAPSDYRSFDAAVQDVTDAVKVARKEGIVVVPIYFASNICKDDINLYKKMYGNEIIATKPEGIKTELVEFLQNVFLKNGK